MMPTTGSPGASIAHEEATPAQEILPTTQIYMPPANLPPPKPLVMDYNLATNWNAESVDKIRGRHRRKQAGTTGKSLSIVVSYWRGCHESLRCLRMGRN